MNKAEATALFERIVNVLSKLAHPVEIKLIYVKGQGILVPEEWVIVVGDEVIECEEHWQDYKHDYTVHETDQDLEQYADAMRAQAESRLT